MSEQTPVEKLIANLIFAVDADDMMPDDKGERCNVRRYDDTKLGVEHIRCMLPSAHDGPHETVIYGERERYERTAGPTIAEQCRMCGTYLRSGLPGFPPPLLPGDIPARRQVCDDCAGKYGPFPEERYTPSWAT